GFATRGVSVGFRDDAVFGAGLAVDRDRFVIIELLGVNDAARDEWDATCEKAKSFDDIVARERAAGRIDPGWVVCDEPVTGSTTTGSLQKKLRAVNRARHAMVGAYRQRYPNARIKFVKTNDETYFFPG